MSGLDRSTQDGTPWAYTGDSGIGSAPFDRSLHRNSTIVGMVEYRVVARNPARTSENRIHDDEVAKRHGFRGGLVPGVTVYAYACAAIVDSLGPEFGERGSARLRFVAPVYDGDTAVARVGSTGHVD